MEEWETRIKTLKKLCEDLKLQYQENELHIANRTIAQDKGLDTQLFFKHRQLTDMQIFLWLINHYD